MNEVLLAMILRAVGTNPHRHIMQTPLVLQRTDTRPRSHLLSAAVSFLFGVFFVCVFH